MDPLKGVGGAAPVPRQAGGGPVSGNDGNGALRLAAPAGGQHGGGSHGVQEAALRLRAYRQQLIASNIANADTPNYKAVDIDFPEALRAAMGGAHAGPVRLAVTAPGHLSGNPVPVPATPLKYHVPAQPSADGNTVELDVERTKFAENAIRYEFALDRVRSHYRHMEELFKNLK